MAYKTEDGCIRRPAICRGFSLDLQTFYVTLGNNAWLVKRPDTCQTPLTFILKLINGFS